MEPECLQMADFHTADLVLRVEPLSVSSPPSFIFHLCCRSDISQMQKCNEDTSSKKGLIRNSSHQAQNSDKVSEILSFLVC